MDSLFFLFLSPAELFFGIAGPEEAKNLAGKKPPPVSDPFSDAESGESYASLSSQFPTTPNRRFKFQKRGQLLICTHNETLSVAAMRVSNKDRSPATIHG
jgi:hypothetical protein